MKKFLSVFLIILTILPISGCSTKQPTSRSLFCFNTYIEITVYDADLGTDIDAVLDECIEMCKNYEALFSKTIETSDVYAINNRTRSKVSINETTAYLIQGCIKYNQLTYGAFDITIAPLVELWDITGENPTVPTNAEISTALSSVNCDNLSISDNSIILNDDKCKIDLGGIVKGYVADMLKSYMTESGITSAIIDLGGNILCVGSKDDKDFNIGIKKPFSEENEMIATVSVSDKSVVTSGVYERYFEKDGNIYHHIFDPKTGYPVDNELYSVTIISDSSEDGDALSTAVFILGLEAGLELINYYDDIEAVFVTNNYEIIVSDGLTVDNSNISLK